MWFIFIAVYIIVLLLSIVGNFDTQKGTFNLQTSSDWVKVIFGRLLQRYIFLGLYCGY